MMEGSADSVKQQAVVVVVVPECTVCYYEWGGGLTDGAANRKERSEVTSLDHVWKIKADFYRPGLF